MPAMAQPRDIASPLPPRKMAPLAVMNGNGLDHHDRIHAHHANGRQKSPSSGGLLKDQLEIVKYRDEEGRKRYTIRPVEGQLSFDKGFFMFVRAVQLLTQRTDGIIVVGLAGPSGSGKTAFSEKIRSFLPGCAILSMDNYNDASRVIDGNFDDPRLSDYDLLTENIKDLKEGKPIEAPIYDFKQSKRVGYRRVEVPSSRVVIVEGIYALSARLRPLLDLRVSIRGGVHFDLVKRVLRDINRSGQEPEEIIQQISDTVYPMYKAYIEPDLKMAHLKIYNTFNPFSGFMNATYILKSDKQVSRQEVKAVLKPNHTAKTETETYDIYLVPPGEDPETCQSWLRMRNRDGRYNLMFEEWVTEGPFIISPRITFEVSVRILGGLMALGYEIGTIMKRTSTVYSDDRLTIKYDDIEGMGQTFLQVQGKDRALVGEVGKKLGLDGTYIPRSYIEQVQLAKLTASFQTVTEDMKRRFVVDGEPLIDESDIVGASPMSEQGHSFRRNVGFVVPPHPPMSSSAPKEITRPRSASSSGSGGGGSGGMLSVQMEAANGRPASHSSRDLDTSLGGGGRGQQGNGASEQQRLAEESRRDLAQPSAALVLAKVEKAMGAISEKVDEITIRPEVFSASIEQQLQALLKQHEALVEQVASNTANTSALLQLASSQQHSDSASRAGHSSWSAVMPAAWAAGGMVVGVAATLVALNLVRRVQ